MKQSNNTLFINDKNLISISEKNEKKQHFLAPF